MEPWILGIICLWWGLFWQEDCMGVGAFGGHGCRIFAVFPGRKIAAVEVQDGIFVFSAYLPYFFRRYSVILPYWGSDKRTLLP